MTEFPLYKNILLLASGIEACIEKKLNSSALILIYSGIDTVGWLDSAEEFATKTSFKKWVDTYLLKTKHWHAHLWICMLLVAAFCTLSRQILN